MENVFLLLTHLNCCLILTCPSLQTVVMLGPFMPPEDQGDLLLHVILWPVLGGLLILVVLIVVLYFVSWSA